MAATLATVAAKSVAEGCPVVSRALDALPEIRTNVGPAERTVSAVVGTALSVYGFDGRGPSLLSVLAGGYLLFRGATGNCPVRQALGLSASDATAPNSVIAAGHGTRVDFTVSVNRDPVETYKFWRDFENLPRFMTHLKDVDTTTDGRSHWVAEGPLGTRVEWDAQIIADRPGEVISWKSLDGSDVDAAGSVHFRRLPEGGTAVTVSLKYDPPGGKFGTAVAWLFGASAEKQVREDVQRFKAALERQPVEIKVKPQPQRAGGRK
jgi:uncharacterized membrane protein